MNDTTFRYHCANCGDDWWSRAVADDCCSQCEALVGERQCGKPRTWSAPLGSRLFPLGYCDEHRGRACE